MGQILTLAKNVIVMWIKKNLNPLGKNTGDCVVRAIAYATGKTWDEVYQDLCDMGYQRAEMPSINSNWWAYLKDHGYKRNIIPDSCPYCYTVSDFCMEHPAGRYILFIPHSDREGVGHVVAVDNGNYIDTWDSGNCVPLVYWKED